MGECNSRNKKAGYRQEKGRDRGWEKLDTEPVKEVEGEKHMVGIKRSRDPDTGFSIAGSVPDVPLKDRGITPVLLPGNRVEKELRGSQPTRHITGRERRMHGGAGSSQGG